MKKHVSQMSQSEINYLCQRFRSIPENRWKFNPYSMKRARERGIDMAVFRTFWTDGFDLVEFHYHELKDESRILLRTVSTDENDNQVCAVFNFTTLEITTVYLNWRRNKHKGLVWGEYTPFIDVKGMMLAQQV